MLGSGMEEECISGGDQTLVTALMPCLNEANCLAGCIDQAHVGCQATVNLLWPSSESTPVSGLDSNIKNTELPLRSDERYEVLVADNGSTDGSPEIAARRNARVVHVQARGYGAALLGGIAAARGKYIVMGDADGSYDFGEIPRFIKQLEAGSDLVVGNRFAGGILPGAMPWHHRYIGNPLLSGLGRLLFRVPCRDWHCGLRAFDREKFLGLQLQSSGMEFASEMIIRASQSQFRMSELPIRLHPDRRNGPTHLRSFSDGIRHLRLILRLAFKGATPR